MKESIIKKYYEQPKGMVSDTPSKGKSMPAPKVEPVKAVQKISEEKREKLKLKYQIPLSGNHQQELRKKDMMSSYRNYPTFLFKRKLGTNTSLRMYYNRN